jgi:hypothetical protein
LLAERIERLAQEWSRWDPTQLAHRAVLSVLQLSWWILEPVRACWPVSVRASVPGAFSGGGTGVAGGAKTAARRQYLPPAQAKVRSQSARARQVYRCRSAFLQSPPRLRPNAIAVWQQGQGMRMSILCRGILTACC